MDPIDAPQEPARTDDAAPDAPGDGTQPTRRRFLIGGAVAASVVAAGVGIAVKAASGSDGADDDDGAAEPATDSDIPQPLLRWSFADSTERWATSGSAAAAVSHDPSGWLVASGRGRMQVESARDVLGRPMDWTDARDTARRVSVTVRADGPASSYPVSVAMCWQTPGSSEIGTVTSAPFAVPSGRDVDLDTWWDCRGTAPSDVLTRVQGVKIGIDSGSDQIQLRIKNIRQPATTTPYGREAYGLATVFHAAAPAGLVAAAAADPYQEATLAKLTAVDTWRTTNHRAIHIGEWGWPKETSRDVPGASASDASFGALAEQWLRQCDRLAIPYTPWGESAYWAGMSAGSQPNYGSYPLANYYCGSSTSDRPDNGQPRVVDALKPSAKRLESHMNVVPDIVPSINLVGMCFVYLKDGSEYSSTNIGTRGYDYFTENPDTIEYLHDRGYRMFRLPFRWDRVMRTPEGGLDEDEWGYVRAGIEAILSLPDTSVIVDEHSSATFWISSDPEDTSVPAVQHVVDGHDGRLTVDHFTHFWSLVSGELRGVSDRLAYEITNEPHASTPFAVKRYTQAVVSSLRAAGDDTFCLIPSHPYDNITTAFAEQNQPFPWIVDPAGSRRHAYTLHHYMDYEQSGQYALSYADTLAKYE